MKIGFDIDGVLADLNSDLRAITEKAFHVKVPNPTPHMYIINVYSGLPDKEADDFFWSLVAEENLFAKVTPDMEFINLCNKCLDEPEIDVYIVTHRFYKDKGLDPEKTQQIVETDTIKWLQKYLPKINSEHILFVEDKKAPVVKELGLDLYIDDRIYNAEDIADVSSMSLIRDRAYNKDAKETKSIRIFKAKDVEAIIKGLKIEKPIDEIFHKKNPGE